MRSADLESLRRLARVRIGTRPARTRPQARSLALLALLAALLTLSLTARADSPAAPAAVQARLLARVVPFDREFSKKVGAAVVVLVVSKADDAESTQAALHLRKALEDIGEIGGRPVNIRQVTFAGIDALAGATKESSVNVLYVSSGLSEEVPGIAKRLTGSGVLSVAALESDVPRGIVLGVTLADGKPRMGINLSQARSQRVDFPATLLKLARVY